jgi:phospholipase C
MAGARKGAAMSLDQIEHVVLVMLENRSFDQMLGFLYPKADDFDGLDGTETNLDENGTKVRVFKVTAEMQNAYYYPLANPDEGYLATNDQLFGSDTPPVSGVASNGGFVRSLANYLAGHGHSKQHPLDAKLKGAGPTSIMGMYVPETLPVLSGLAKGFAVCDRWFASVPTQTFPNRAFAVAGTALGYVDNSAHGHPAFDTPSVFGRLAEKNKTWKIYGWSGEPLTAGDFPDTIAPGPHGEVVKGFARFQSDVTAGQLPAFSYIEPEWATYPKAGDTPDVIKKKMQLQNDQHPVSNLAVGEKMLFDVYNALRSNPKTWAKTLLIITYDEHGGNYDHVPPPTGAIAPDNVVGPSGFDFTRFGVRVPAVLVSPLIEAGTKLRAPVSGPPFDHTSIIATLRACFGIGKLNKRDAAAPHVGSALTRAQPRTDDPLAGIKLAIAEDPVLVGDSPPIGAAPSAFLVAKARTVAGLPVPAQPTADALAKVATLKTAADHYEFIQQRLAAWHAAGRPLK